MTKHDPRPAGHTPEATLRQRFVDGMSVAAWTVTLVTTAGPAGRAGVTVSAMSSVSADTPQPTLLVCVNDLSSATTAIFANGVFCVNVLSDQQSALADIFAGRNKSISDKFSVGDWQTDSLGAPRLADALAAFSCRVLESRKIGTHHVIFGAINDIMIAKAGMPLVYGRRAYGRMVPL